MLKEEEEYLSIVVPHKVRSAVLIESETYLKRDDFPYVFIAPIQKLNRKNKSASFLRNLTERNSYAHLHYIGRHTGHEAFVSVADVKRVHISLLLEPHNTKMLDEQTMVSIYRKLGDLIGFDKGKITACQTCELNCENCELRKLSTTSAVNK